MEYYPLPSAASRTHRGHHRVDVDRDGLAAAVGDVAGVVAVPVGAAADGAVVFHGVALARLQLRVGEEHHQAAAAATGPTAATAAGVGGALVGADDRAV